MVREIGRAGNFIRFESDLAICRCSSCAYRVVLVGVCTSLGSGDKQAVFDVSRRNSCHRSLCGIESLLAAEKNVGQQ